MQLWHTVAEVQALQLLEHAVHVFGSSLFIKNPSSHSEQSPKIAPVA